LDPEHIRELFVDFGAIEVRRLFGGAGLFADGVMFGLVSGGEIYLKADAQSVADFEREGCTPFEYGTKHGRRAIMSYWRMPERLYDDAEALTQWARAALAVAQRSAVKPARRRAAKKPVGKRTKKRKR
jgi:DNA transformation protein